VVFAGVWGWYNTVFGVGIIRISGFGVGIIRIFDWFMLYMVVRVLGQVLWGVYGFWAGFPVFS